MLSSPATVLRQPTLPALWGKEKNEASLEIESPPSRFKASESFLIRAASPNTFLEGIKENHAIIPKSEQEKLRLAMKSTIEQVCHIRTNSVRFRCFDHLIRQRFGQDLDIGFTSSRYENLVRRDAYTALPLSSNKVFEEKLQQARAILKSASFTTVESTRDAWISLARLYLFHPESPDEVFSAYEKYQSYRDEKCEQHRFLLSKSIEIARLGAESFHSLAKIIATTKTADMAFEAQADLLMQEAQSCYAHQGVESSGLIDTLYDAAHCAPVFRLAQAGKIYSSLVDHSSTADHDQYRLREKIANAFVLMGCNARERDVPSPMLPNANDCWSLDPALKTDYEVYGPGPREELYPNAGAIPSKKYAYYPQFTEQCFREAAMQLKIILQQTDLEPVDWLRLHCKYASALIKQGLSLPFTHSVHDTTLPIIDREIKEIKRFFMSMRHTLSDQHQVRFMTQIADLKYADAHQRPYRNSSLCWSNKQLQRAIKQRQAITLANKAYRLMESSGGAEVMPQENHFLKRRSSLSPEFERIFDKTPYAGTAAAIHGFTQQWSSKVHIMIARDCIKTATLYT